MLSEVEVKQLNDFASFLSFKINWVFNKFINCSEKIILLVYGNQGGKTGGTAYQYVLRILGMHPIAKKNILYFECKNNHAVAPIFLPENKICKECGEELKEHKRGSRIFRFCSETLPGQSANVNSEGLSAEVKNTQYPEFKKWLPHFLIKKEITARSFSMIIRDPYGGQDIIIEFVSYNQSVQSTAGTQRVSIWFDESPSFAFYEEQLPRLIAEDGDMIFTYTPVDRSSWLFDKFFEKAKIYYKSNKIIEYLKTQGQIANSIEVTSSPNSIVIIQAATDDNPTLKVEVIDSMFAHVDDQDVISIRRYGIFKQLSGRIFKEFDYNTHFIDKDKYFPDDIPYTWIHARGIDYHPQTNWACGMMALSPNNEAFVYGDWNPSPEKYTIREIARELAVRGKDYMFRLNLIDPLSEATKMDSISVRYALNESFKNLRKEEGIGTGGEWTCWDTKGERGRDAIRERLKNSKLCHKPFNNRVVKDGIVHYLPTLWILNNCKTTAEYIRNWRWEEWADATALHTKEAKNMPEQKWSHFCMVLEAIFKHSSFRTGISEFSGRNYSYFRR